MKAYLGKRHITILDTPWTVFFQTEAQYSRIHGDNSRAVTVTKTRQMFFCAERIYPKDHVAIHELTHAYTAESMGHDLEKTPEQTEEFFCVLFETRGRQILEQAKPLTKLLHTYSKRLMKQRRQQKDDEDNGE